MSSSTREHRMPPAEHIGGKVQMADVREENFKTGNYRCTNHEFPAPLKTYNLKFFF